MSTSGTFRDPAGLVFSRRGAIYRQVNASYASQYHQLLETGLYDSLVADALMIGHEEVDDETLIRTREAYRILKPAQVPFISYPYEWAFSMYKEAALLLLEIQRRALNHGMTLREARAYDVQFAEGRPMLIDTLAFDSYTSGDPWSGYEQFCQQFLAPLALMSFVDVSLGQLMRVYINGVPLELAAKLLPRQTWLRPGQLLHIHLNSSGQVTDAQPRRLADLARQNIRRQAIDGLIDNLTTTIQEMRWDGDTTDWTQFRDDDAYSSAAYAEKQRLIRTFLADVRPEVVWEIGAGAGDFAKLVTERGAHVVAWDGDPSAVNAAYRRAKTEDERDLLPLLMDITNPSPGLGWSNTERMSMATRADADLVMALALGHHLVLGENIPLRDVAAFFATLGPWLIIEFVPTRDPRAETLFGSAEDSAPHYTQETFEAAFDLFYEVIHRQHITESERVLYLLRKRQTG